MEACTRRYKPPRGRAATYGPDVPFSKHEDRNSKDEWMKEVAAEAEKGTAIENTDAPEATQAAEENLSGPSQADIKHGVSILKAFDAVLAPVRKLLQRLFQVKTKEESDSVLAELSHEMKKIEQADDNELVQAVTQLMVDGFEDRDETVANSECHVTDHLCRIHDASTIAALKQKASEAEKKAAEKTRYTPGAYDPDPKN